jgi:hypothetical protein
MASGTWRGRLVRKTGPQVDTASWYRVGLPRVTSGSMTMSALIVAPARISIPSHRSRARIWFRVACAASKRLSRSEERR